MSKFLYTQDEKTRDLLVQCGFKCIQVKRYKDKTQYIFLNDTKKLNFSNIDGAKYALSDTMTF